MCAKPLEIVVFLRGEVHRSRHRLLIAAVIVLPCLRRRQTGKVGKVRDEGFKEGEAVATGGKLGKFEKLGKLEKLEKLENEKTRKARKARKACKARKTRKARQATKV